MFKNFKKQVDEWDNEFFSPIYTYKKTSQDDASHNRPEYPSYTNNTCKKENEKKTSIQDVDYVDIEKNEHIQVGFISTRGNLMPNGLKWGQVRCINGHIIRYAHYHNKESLELGTVVIMSSKGDYIEKYFETIEDLIKRNISVVCFDNPGDGLSHIKKDVFEKKGMDIYKDALRAIMKTVVFPYHPRPYFLFSVGTGCIPAFQYIHHYKRDFLRTIMVSPLLSIPIKRKPYWFHKLLFSFKAFVFPTASAINDIHSPTINITHDFKNNIYTHDLVRFQRCITPMQKIKQLSNNFFTHHWFMTFEKALDKLKKHIRFNRYRVTILFVCAEDDTMQSYKIVQKFAQKLRQSGFVKIPLSQHDILNENNAIRKHFWATFDNFIPGYNGLFNKK